jgi:AI-2E family transporter
LPLILSVAIFDGWVKPLETFGLFAVTEILVSNFVEPMLYGAYTGISSMAILLAAIFWTAIWGPIGLVLCTPLTVCLVVIGRHVPRLGFLNVLLGDEPVLTPDTRYYQRLLALDHEEAKRVLEGYLEQKPLEDLYDMVLVPALSLAERDRHRERLDKKSADFIVSNTRRIVAELFEERRNETHAVNSENEAPVEPSPQQSSDQASASQPESKTKSGASTPLAPRTPISALKIAVFPARDEVDEIVATMLCQLLARAGYTAQCIPLGRTSEMIAKTAQYTPDIVCLSALPPYALSHAKSAYTKLCAQLPRTDMLFGIWNYPGDLDRLAVRVGLSDDHLVATTLNQALTEIAGRGSSSGSPVSSPLPVTSDAIASEPVPSLTSPVA